MHRTFLYKSSIFALGILLLVSCNNRKTIAEKPNILIIQADDLGFDDLGIHGNRHIETPAIDRLGHESVQFPNFYVSSVCAPTRAALLTGRNFLRTGVAGVHAGRDFLNLDETTIAEVFQQAGYKTGMWGKWHSGKTNGYLPWDRGFDEAYYACLYNYFDNTGLLNGNEVQTQGYVSDVLTDMAIQFVSDNQNEPFFAYLSHLAPHNPWRAPEAYIQKYEAKGLSRELSTLYGMIDNLDHNVDRILQKLDELSLTENTIVIFLSDNGPWIRSYRFGLSDNDWALRNVHGLRGTKGKNWENGIRSPLFIKWGKHFKPYECMSPTKVEDIYPTLLNLAGIVNSGSKELDGIDIEPLMQGKSLKNNPVYIAHFNPNGNSEYLNEKDKYGQAVPFDSVFKSTFLFQNQRLAMISSNYKYIQNEESQKGLLFDLQENPKEEDKAIVINDALQDSLQAELKNWYTELTSSESSFTVPVFQIGFNNQAISQIYAYAPFSISQNLINKEHFLSNWQQVGDEASYKVKVNEPAKYEVYLIHKMEHFKSVKFAVSVSGSSAADYLKENCERKFGTLIEGESAYWENFDLPQTFKKDIRISSIGFLNLSQGLNTLKVSLEDAGIAVDDYFNNQLIAIQLVVR